MHARRVVGRTIAIGRVCYTDVWPGWRVDWPVGGPSPLVCWDAEANVLGELGMFLPVGLLASGGDSGHPITVARRPPRKARAFLFLKLLPAGKGPLGNVRKSIESFLPVGAICERTRRMRWFEGRSRNPPTRTTVCPMVYPAAVFFS